MNKQPLLILVICLILGILFQDRFSLDEIFVYWIIGGCFALLIALFFHSYILHKIKPFLLGLLFFGTGIVLHSFNKSEEAGNITVPVNKTIIFKISKKLNSTEKYKKYESSIQQGKEKFKAIVYIPENQEELDFSHYYKAEAYITKPKSPQYDFQFNYADYLKRKGIQYQCYLSNNVSSGVRYDLSVGEKISQKRLELLQTIDHTKISSKSREFLKGIILADRTEIDPGTVQDFNRSGLVHFLAISGTHIVVIFGIFYFLLTSFLPLRFRKYAIILSLVFIWMFAGFIGFGNSVLRSCIMLSVYFIYILLQRKPDLLHSLALSALVILVLDTWQLFDIGFQLSFAAVLGIFWLNQPILKYFPKQDNYFKKLLFNTVSISVSAQLATLPLVLYYFHQFSFISVFANFFIVPFSEAIIVFSFLMTAFIAVGADFQFLNIAYDRIIQILLKIIHWFADFDVLFFENIPMNQIEVLLLLVLIYLLRSAIVRFNFENSERLVMMVLAFFIIRVSSNIIENQKEETLIHHFSGRNVFSVKKGNIACFWIEDNQERNKIIRYIVNPYIASKRLNSAEIRTFTASVQKVVYKGEMYNVK